MADFVLIPAILIGLIIAVVELVFVHQDESGLGWLSHGFHAIPIALFLTFISMNVPWVLGLSFMTWVPIWVGTFVIPPIMGVIAAIKVKSAAAIAKGGSVGESWMHALIIGALIAAAPFIWFLVGDLLMGIFPILNWPFSA